MRPWIVFALALGSLLCPGWAEPRIASHRAWAPNEIVRPIRIEVVVSNDGELPAEEYALRLTLTPDVSPELKRGATAATMLDPFEYVQEVRHLGPRESVKVEFETPYFATAPFERRGSFLVDNLIPNIRRSIRVNYRVTLQPIDP